MELYIINIKKIIKTIIAKMQIKVINHMKHILLKMLTNHWSIIMNEVKDNICI